MLSVLLKVLKLRWTSFLNNGMAYTLHSPSQKHQILSELVLRVMEVVVNLPATIRRLRIKETMRSQMKKKDLSKRDGSIFLEGQTKSWVDRIVALRVPRFISSSQ